MWCWRRLFRVSWTARKSNQSILKEISPEYSLEGLMLKLKLQFFGHLMWRTDSLEKTLMLGKIQGGSRRGWWQRMRMLDGITDSMDMSLSSSGSWWWTGRPGMLWSMGLQRVGHNWATELNWMQVISIIWTKILTCFKLILGLDKLLLVLDLGIYAYKHSIDAVYFIKKINISSLGML